LLAAIGAATTGFEITGATATGATGARGSTVTGGCGSTVTGACGATVTGGCGAGLGAGAGANFGAAEITGAEGAGGIPGGSSNAVYSRDKRPADQVSSTSRSMKGSVTARVVAILRKGCPSGRFSTVRRAPASAELYCRFAWR
jgi:hypothetical protein